jgi:hypothetical protein
MRSRWPRRRPGPLGALILLCELPHCAVRGPLLD